MRKPFWQKARVMTVSLEGTMLSYSEYRQFAVVCSRWAQNAKSEQQRSQFLEMAEAWAELAENARARRCQATERMSAA
jgi:hypothetical protein